MQKYTDKLIIRTDAISKIDNVEAERSTLHEHIEIKYFYEGSSTLIIGTEAIYANAGDIVVINPYEFHATIAHGNPKGKYHLFMISPDYFDFSRELDLRAMLFARMESFAPIYRQNSRMNTILTSIADEYSKKLLHYESAITGLMTELFALFLRGGVIKKRENAINKSILNSYRVIEPAMRHIRDNYRKQITVDALSSICGISKHYFCRVFKAITGKSSMEYLRDYRLAVCDTLLLEADKSISEISELCGFENVNYLYRSYKSKYGISPGKRRKAK
ncbi:MAG: AraC family transcriptional regulator [Clostridia bacterium]|nr:AraC family transcriptional regulator [Clostridia bacterium]